MNDEDGDDVVILESPPKQMPSYEKERRALQPLSPQEVKHRSPQVISVKKGGPIVPEHLIISPDGRKPILGLAQDSSHQNHPFSPGRDASKSLWKHNDSPVRALSQKLFSSPSNSPVKESPSKQKSFTPTKLLEKGKKHMGAGMPLAGRCSPQSGFCTPTKQAVLVADSPDSSYSQRSSLSPSSACRKLSFFVPDSEGNSFNNSPAPFASSTERLGRPSSVDMATVRDALSSRHNVSLTRPAIRQSPLKNSPLNDSEKGRRLSVCLQKTVPASDEEDSVESSPIRSEVGNGNGSDKSENEFNAKGRKNPLDDNEEDICTIPSSDEEEEEDKENEPLSVRKVGRNRIVSVSDSNSDSGSCFEVEDSEEDDVVESSEENASPDVEDANCKEEQASAAHAEGE